MGGPVEFYFILLFFFFCGGGVSNVFDHTTNNQLIECLTMGVSVQNKREETVHRWLLLILICLILDISKQSK